MGKKFRLSVIIPVLNEEENIGRLIQFLKRHGEGFVEEIIVSDGGSEDKTVEIALKHGATVVKSEGSGRALQMNAGAAAAKSPVLYFLHADTTPPEDFCFQIANALSHGADAGSFTLQFDIEHRILKLYSFFTRFPCTWLRFGDQSLFVKRSLFDLAGGFRNELIVMEDQQIVRDLKRAGEFTLIQKPVITSARKYQTTGVFKLQFIFTIIWLGYYLGSRQSTLVHIYKRLIRTE